MLFRLSREAGAESAVTATWRRFSGLASKDSAGKACNQALTSAMDAMMTGDTGARWGALGCGGCPALPRGAAETLFAFIASPVPAPGGAGSADCNTAGRSYHAATLQKLTAHDPSCLENTCLQVIAAIR